MERTGMVKKKSLHRWKDCREAAWDHQRFGQDSSRCKLQDASLPVGGT